MKTSKHLQIQQSIIEALETGRWSVSDKLPSDRGLAQEMGCTFKTIERALRELVNQGYLLRRPRQGTFVAAREYWQAAQLPDPCIGVILDFGADLFPALNEELFSRGYRMLARKVPDDLASALQAVQDMVNLGICGIIWTPISTPHYAADNLQFVQAILDTGLPAVAVDRVLEEIEVNSVVSDNAYAGYLLTKYLLDQGHRRIGLVRHIHGTSTQDRHRGYERALREYGVTPEPDWVIQFEHHQPHTVFIEQLRRWLAAISPTAAWATSGQPMGQVLFAAAQAEGLSIPSDISLASFDEIIAPCPVTSIIQPYNAIGQRAAALLCDEIAHPTNEIQRIVLRSRLVEGTSCRPPTPEQPQQTTPILAQV